MLNPSTLPTNPGCYLFKDNKNIIYIGKAKNLKKRVSSYFTKKHSDNKTIQLLKNIKDVDFIVTNSEVEALILENTLIKKHKPKFNIDLKDSKRYAYIKITKEDYPRVLISRDEKAYGPFTSGSEREYILNFLKKTFKLRTCKKLPKKPCLRHHINLCDAPCINNISKAAYNEKISSAKLVLKGKNKELIKKLEDNMKKASKSQNFEKAKEYRDIISSLKFLNERQNMDRNKKYDEDIINYMVKDEKVYLLLFNIYKGTLSNKQEFIFDNKEDFLGEFIKRYYENNDVPKEIILPKKIDPAISTYLKSKIIIPKIGEKKQLLELVRKNIEISFFIDIKKLEALKDKLKLNDLPSVIECFDISHLSGTATVGSMVQFRNAKPDKSNYRRFKIRSHEEIDDFRSIAEVVGRRYKRLKEENAPLPNLIIIDGGKGQLSFALEQLKLLNLKIPIISIAKKDEEIFVPGMSIPIRLSKKETALKFIQEIRDEAHRFAIKYNRILRKI